MFQTSVRIGWSMCGTPPNTHTHKQVLIKV